MPSAEPDAHAPARVGLTRPGHGPVAVHLRIPFGSGVEDRAREGLVHLLEHLVVAGLPEAVRPRFTAATGRDAMVFETLATGSETAHLVDVLLEAVRHPRLDRESVAGQLRVVNQERRERGASPAWRLQQHFLALWWAGTSWAHSPLGQEEALADVTPGRLEQVHQQWLSTPGTILSVAGPPTALTAPGQAAVHPTAPARSWPTRTGVFATSWNYADTGRSIAAIGIADEITSPAQQVAQDLADLLLTRAGGPPMTTHRLGRVRASWMIRPTGAPDRPLLEALIDAAQRARTLLGNETGHLDEARLRRLRQIEGVSHDAAWIADPAVAHDGTDQPLDQRALILEASHTDVLAQLGRRLEQLEAAPRG